MKFLHLSDLHLAKRVNEVSMLDDQDYILHQILEITDAEHPDAVVIAGDVYDKSVPSGEAITLFDWFLVALAKRSIPVLLISGNHDSPERLAFGNRLLDASGIHISPVYDGQIHPVILQDEHGPVHFWLLPFIKPAHVKRFLPDEPIESYTDACRAAIAQMNVDFSARNVLVTHQFVTGANTCESEELSVGGADNVDASVFEGFNYVALGHIHGPQNIGSNRIRYCGTPLKGRSGAAALPAVSKARPARTARQLCRGDEPGILHWDCRRRLPAHRSHRRRGRAGGGRETAADLSEPDEAQL